MSATLHSEYGRTTRVERHRQGRRVALGAAATVAVLLAGAVAVVAHRLVDDQDRNYLSTNGWPAQGQGAYVLGNGAVAASPREQPVPIASVAKVMTAYVVLEHYPLRGDDDSGRQFVVDQSDVSDTEARRREDQSVIAVQAGERLTEREALMAILLPSANNVAALVAREVGGSVAAFVAEMNNTARALGLTQTHYTDPSGYDDHTTSTAIDQLRLARVVASNATLIAMMDTRSFRVPVAGTVTNTDILLGHDGFVGMKTGSDSAAGGCFMFLSWRHTDDGNEPLIGVVLGQPGHDLIRTGQYAAEQLVDRVAPVPAQADR